MTTRADMERWSQRKKELAMSEYATTKAEVLKKTQRVPLDLVCPAGDAHEAIAMKDGLIKYGYASFLNDGVPISARSCLAAIRRHTTKLLAGEDYSHDGVVSAHHAGHIRAMAGIYLECMEAGTLIDDRHPRHKKDNYISRMFDRMADQAAKMADLTKTAA